MERETLEMLCKVAGKLSGLKHFLAESVDRDVYLKARETLSDCQEYMAVHCDCAPIALIAGRADDIMANLEFSKKTVPLGT
jgi:hypothetical protein